MIKIKIFKAVFVLTFFSVLTRFLGFGFKVILSRNISTEMLGLYTIAISIFVVLATTLASGMPVTISKLTAENKSANDPKKTHQQVTGALVFGIVLSIIIILLVLLSKTFLTFNNMDLTIYYLLIAMLPAVLFTGIYAPFRGYLWGKEKYLHVSLVEFIEQIIRITSCVILFLFLDNSDKIFATGISLSIACVLSTILGIVFYISQKGKFSYNKSRIKPVVKSSLTITSVRVASSIMQPILSIIIPLRLVAVGFTKEQALSSLGIAMGMTVPILLIPSTIIGSLAMVLIPKISSLVKEKNNDQLKKQITSSILFTLCCTLIVVPIFIGLGKEICILIFKNEMAGEYLVNASWLVVTMCLSQLTTSILNSLGLEVKTFIYYIISSVFLVLAVIFLPKYAGIYSLLYGMGISSLIVSILNIVKINKTINTTTLSFKQIIQLILISIPVILVTKWTYPIIALVFPSFIAIALSAIISVACFISLLTVSGIMKISIFTSTINQIKNYKPNIRKVRKYEKLS